MSKKAYTYNLKLNLISNPEGNNKIDKKLSFNFNNHDDIFKILEMSKDKDLFVNHQDNIEFFIGLKLLTEVLLRNRKTSHSITKDLTLAIGDFMKQLKTEN